MFKTPARRAQLFLAAGFLSFGLTWLAAPTWMIKLFGTAELPVVPLALTALGAHAIAAGLFSLFAPFRSWTFVGFGFSLLPLFFADYWLYAKSGAFNEMILVHATGMAILLGVCMRAFSVMQRQERLAEQAA